LPPDTPTAFFSYSRDDSEFALRLAEDLKAAGANVWLDQLDIAPGQRWARAVQDALNSSPRMLVILSPSSVNSTHVEDEVNFALEEHKTVIPIFYQDCKVPFQLRPFQYVDFRTDYVRGLKVMLKTLGVEQQMAASVAATAAPAESQRVASGAAEQARLEEERNRAADQARLEETRRLAAEQARVEEEHKQAAEQARLEQERRQAAEQARLEQERKQAAEQARLEQERKLAAERARLEEERKQVAERARLEEERKQVAERARLEQERKQAAEQARLEEERKQVAERARLEQERRRLSPTPIRGAVVQSPRPESASLNKNQTNTRILVLGARLIGSVTLIVVMLRWLGIRIPIWRWWPLILILWGFIVLIDHVISRRRGYRTEYRGTAAFVWLIAIVTLCVYALDLGGISESEYTFDDALEQSFPARGNLRVVCDRCALKISSSDGNTLRVVVHKRLLAHNQNEANWYNKGTRPQITVTGSTVLLNANTNGAGEHAVQGDMGIFVPRDAMVDIASKRGDVTLDDITGAAKINLDKGSVRASKVVGDLDVEGHIDSVSIDECGGAVHLGGDFFRDMRLSKIAKMVTFKSSRSDMEIASVPGEIEIATDSVRGFNIQGPARLVTTSKDIHLDDVLGDLQVETTNGGVEVSVADKLPVGKMTITAKHGDITLTLPANAGFQIEASTRKGDITSDFSAIKISNGTSQASGTVGNGASKLQIGTDTGDIRIVKK
jgi:TIR domain/Putative adhesin